VDDARLYGAVAEELERGRVRKDLWAKALIESCGDEPAAHELYVRLCAEQLGIERAEASIPRDQGVETAPDTALMTVSVREPDSAEEPRSEALFEEDAEPEASAAEGPSEAAGDEVAVEPVPTAVAPPQWTPHKPGLARATVVLLVLGGAGLVGALGLAIAGSEGAGLVLGVVAVVLLGSGFSRVEKANHYRGPLH
jgi:hypothetical protein